MNRLGICQGQELDGMFRAATLHLERSAQAINLLNVFPVPDGDTGTNMLLTMRAAMEEAGRCRDRSAAAIAQAMARGALMGARGNSGVIMSQILHGLAQGLEDKESFSGHDLAAALMKSTTYAYKAVSQPVEGTMLTVIREAAAAAQTTISTDTNDVLAVLESAVSEAEASVFRTPSLLPVLRQAGVVDAGGQGLHTVLEGALRYLRGQVAEEEMAEIAPVAPVLAATAPRPVEEAQYGYCTEFLLEGTGLNLEAIRERLIDIGESVLVVGDETTVRAHLHTFDPGAALSLATSLGTLRQVKVENMQEQHRDFIVARQQEFGPPMAEISTVAVVSGEGLARAFSSLGTTTIVPGGETMNPSVRELLQAVEQAPSAKVIILPNNPNVLLAAGQARELTAKEVAVVPTESIPQGIAALLAFRRDANLEVNVTAMKEAITTVRSGEVTTAVRSMELDGLAIDKGQAIAFLDGELVAASDNMPEAVHELLLKTSVEQGGLITIYYGADADSTEVQHIVNSIQQRYPEQEVEVVAGGQPHYDYIISVE